MITKTSAIAFRRNLGAMIDRVRFRHESIVITRYGRPAAALIEASLFKRIHRMQNRFDKLTGRMAKSYASVPMEDGEAEIELAAVEVRREYRRRRIPPT